MYSLVKAEVRALLEEQAIQVQEDGTWRWTTFSEVEDLIREVGGDPLEIDELIASVKE